jgi:hypothetical protein
MTKPEKWIEEDRGEIASTIVDGIVSEMTLERMRQIVWDLHYEEIVWKPWREIWDLAEEYAPELLDKFNEPSS